MHCDCGIGCVARLLGGNRLKLVVGDLDHIEDFIHEQAAPLIRRLQHEVNPLAAARYRWQKPEPSLEIDDRDDPPTQIEEPREELWRSWNGCQPSCTQDFGDLGGRNGETATGDQEGGVAADTAV